MSKLREKFTSGGLAHDRFYDSYSNSEGARGYVGSFNSDSSKGYHRDQPLFIKHVTRVPLRLNGRVWVNDVMWTEYTDYGVSNTPWVDVNMKPSPSLSQMSTAVVAKTNPSTPVVDIPLFVFELKDLPRMYKQAVSAFKALKGSKWLHYSVDDAAAATGSGYLGWQFGWKPLVNDIIQMVSFAKSVEKRMNQLKIISDSKVLTHTIENETVRGYATNKAVTGWYGGGVYVDAERILSRRTWGYSRWSIPQDTLLRPDIEARVRDIALGLDFYPAQVWNAVPWTWMTDWFSSFGDYIAANQGNLLGTKLDTVCICRETTDIMNLKVRRIAQTSNSTVTSNGSYSEKTVTKQRFPGELSPFAASLPILTNGQINIVGSLAATRGRKATA